MRLVEIRALRRRLGRELEGVHEDIDYQEDELRDLREKARDLEKRLKNLREEEEEWPAEPEEVRCVCGEALLMRRASPYSAAHREVLVFGPPEGPDRGPDAGAESCPGCGMEPESLVDLLAASAGAAPTRAQAARSRELQPELLPAGAEAS